MKSIILAIALLSGLSVIKANTFKAEVSNSGITLVEKTNTTKVPLLIYGRAKINGNSVTCLGGKRLCAVIPQLNDDGSPTIENVIIIYNEDGSVLDEINFSSFSITENGEDTTVNWIP